MSAVATLPIVGFNGLFLGLSACSHMRLAFPGLADNQCIHLLLAASLIMQSTVCMVSTC